AKMYSKLSNGVTKSSNYNQCARNIACLMKMVYDNNIKMPEKIGFYVLLPKDHKSINDFNTKMDPKSIKANILVRFESYISANNLNENDKKEKGLEWLENSLDDIIDNKIDIKMIYWEDLIKENNTDLMEFY